MSTHDPVRLPPVTSRIALIASARYPIREPFPGGLEAHTAGLASRLRRRGHDVTVFGAPGSDPGLRVREMAVLPPISPAARSDVGMPAEWFLAEHHSYLRAPAKSLDDLVGGQWSMGVAGVVAECCGDVADAVQA
ncbi:glycosyltransferase [Pseudonocardia sp. ICBG1142]|uniref:glycosyltransferase n=1 Tax=Pseudonocardia sp. ICBG1142 TaxID=2846760 RepID=UPI001CF63DDF|nr:glycosyltransferase [Pseudonocardia sp. ICBG1142]